MTDSVRAAMEKLQKEERESRWNHRRSVLINGFERIKVYIQEDEVDDALEEIEAMSTAVSNWEDF